MQHIWQDRIRTQKQISWKCDSKLRNDVLSHEFVPMTCNDKCIIINV